MTLRNLVWMGAVLALLAGCSSGPLAPYSEGTAYRCDNGSTLSVKADGRAVMQGGRGTVVLLRDAGGVGPGQAVYSNPQVRFETGLEPDGRAAFLEGVVPNGRARCVRSFSIF